MKKNYKRYNDGGNGHPQWHGHFPDDFEIDRLKKKIVILNVIGLIIVGLIIEILGTWTCIITDDVL